MPETENQSVLSQIRDRIQWNCIETGNKKIKVSTEIKEDFNGGEKLVITLVTEMDGSYDVDTGDLSSLLRQLYQNDDIWVRSIVPSPFKIIVKEK